MIGRKVWFVCVSVCLFMSIYANAQKSSVSQSEKVMEQKALELFEKENYPKAMSYYEKLLVNAPQDSEYNYFMGVCLVETNVRLKEAVTRLKIAAAKNVNEYVNYYLGRAFHLDYKFQSAIRYYQRFLENYRKKASGVDRLIEMCKNGLVLVNSYSVVDVKEKKVVPVKSFFNSYDIDGVRNRLTSKNKDLASRYDGKGDKDIACLSEDGAYIYFSSYGKSKKNGRDLYRAKRKATGGWDAAEPLDVLNSHYDELYPFLSPDGRTLYFSSQGHNSMGGFDIFKSIYNDITGTWTEPENLGFPINSADNDLFYAVDKNQEYASFASSRENGKDDLMIYKIKLLSNPEQRMVMNSEGLTELSLLAEKKEEKVVAKTESFAPVQISLVEKKYNVSNFPYFNFSINEDLVYHQLGEFRSDQARKLFIDSKNQEFNADSLNLLSDKMRPQLKGLNGREKEQLTHRISAYEQEAYRLSKLSADKYDRVLMEEQEYLKQYVVEVVDMDQQTSSDAGEFKMTSEVLPATGDDKIHSVAASEGVVFYIQVGAFSNRPEEGYFKELASVFEEFSEKDNLRKYFVGSYNNYSEARKRLAVIAVNFPEAFIVAFKNGVVTDLSPYATKGNWSPSQNNQPSGRGNDQVEFRVQVGAYSTDDMNAEVRHSFRAFYSYGVEIKKAGGFVICTVGAFSSYKEATTLKMKLWAAGFDTSFTVAFYKGEKITVEKALELLR